MPFYHDKKINGNNYVKQHVLGTLQEAHSKLLIPKLIGQYDENITPHNMNLYPYFKSLFER